MAINNHTLLFTHAQKQNNGTQDVDDANHTGRQHIRLFLMDTQDRERARERERGHTLTRRIPSDD